MKCFHAVSITRNLKTITFTATLLTSLLISAQGAEYFVSLQGSDAHNGLSQAASFLTIQKGVDTLAEGDTLTILPGEYFESVKRENLGGTNRVTTIRAAIPGTVLLRGDVPAPTFKPAEGRPFVYVADFDRPVQCVNERDTLSMLTGAVSLTDLEFVQGGFYHDLEAGKLYISTTHLSAPDARAYTVSVLGTHGLYLERPLRVVIDGLAATGFNNVELLPSYPGYRGAWGIVIGRGVDCVIRNCTAFLNGGGIVFNTAYTSKGREPGKGNVIEHCRAWANFCRFISEGANIAVFNVNDDTIRDCEAYGGGRGLRLYGSIGPGSIEQSSAWDSSIQIKGGVMHSFDGPGLVDRCIALGDAHVHNLSNSIFSGENAYHRGVETPRDNIRLLAEKDLEPDREFADSINWDYRLQATSRFKGAAPDGSDRGPYPYTANIFYVQADGDDKSDGLSLAQAWKTPAGAATRLRPGDTLYLAPGSYAGGMDIATSKDAPVVIRGRGREPAKLAGPVSVSGSGAVVFERIHFAGPVTVAGGRDIAFLNCVFAETDVPLTLSGTAGVRLEHGRFPAHGPVFTGCSQIYLAGNIFAGAAQPAVATDKQDAIIYSDYNLYGAADSVWLVGTRKIPISALQPTHERYSHIGAGVDVPVAGPFGKGVGPVRPPDKAALHVTAPEVHAVTDTTADIEWRTSLAADCVLSWRVKGNAENAAWTTSKRPFRAVGFSTFSLTELMPDTEYEFQVTFENPARLAGGEGEAKELLLPFRTAAAPRTPIAWYVATNGIDTATGQSREQALRTVSAASTRARAGDTVWVAGGTYTELIHVRSTGTEQRPLTFRSLPGEKVMFDGMDRSLSHAFVMLGKSHIHLDGFYFEGFGFGGVPRLGSGTILVYQSDDVQITRCFSSGRGAGYSPALVVATYSERLLVRNCVAAVGSGLSFQNCPGLQLMNNVFFRNLIQQLTVNNGPDQPFLLERNIITDNPGNKVRAMLLEIARVESLVEKDNAYVLRVPDEEKKLFMFYGTVAYAPAARMFDLKMGDEPPVFTELTRLSLAGYQKRFGDTGSLVVDPAFQASTGLDARDAAGKPVFPPDRIAGKQNLDFPDLFATNPDLVKRGIGLQPEAFKDFHFNTKSKK